MKSKIIFILLSLMLIGLLSVGFSGLVSADDVIIGNIGSITSTATLENDVKCVKMPFPNNVSGYVVSVLVDISKTIPSSFLVKAVIYEYGSNALLGNSSNFTINGGNGWYEIPLDVPVLLVSGGIYWVGIWSQTDLTKNLNIYYDPNGVGYQLNHDSEDFNVTGGVVPSVFNNASTDSACTVNILCKYVVNTTENTDYVNCTGTFEHNENGYWINSSGNWSHYVAYGDMKMEFEINQFNIIILMIMMMFFIIVGYLSKNNKTAALLLIIAGIFTILAMLSTVAYFNGIWYLSSPVFILIAIIFFKDAYLKLTT